MVVGRIVRFICFLLLLTLIIETVPSHGCAANLTNLSKRQNQNLIHYIHHMADLGFILSNDTYGIGSEQREIAEAWGKGEKEEQGYFESKGVAFVFEGEKVIAAYPTDHDFYTLTDMEILTALGDPEECRVNSDESVKLYRYVTAKNRNHLIFIIRKMDSDVYNQVDYVVLHKTDDESEINDNMDAAMNYGLYARKMSWCVIL